MDCENELGLNILLDSEYLLFSIFMSITVIVIVHDYIVQIYDFDTRIIYEIFLKLIQIDLFLRLNRLLRVELC